MFSRVRKRTQSKPFSLPLFGQKRIRRLPTTIREMALSSSIRRKRQKSDMSGASPIIGNARHLPKSRLEAEVDTLTKIREIVADVTQNAVETITDKSDSTNVDGWDSVAQINIIVSVEMEFGASFSAEEMHSLNSVAKIANALKQPV